ncbi:MAG: WD40/YVTN/BNR-like repeat-containing protein [Gammaproteobacteria bacterium]
MPTEIAPLRDRFDRGPSVKAHAPFHTFRPLTALLAVLALTAALPAFGSSSPYPASALKALAWRSIGPFRGGRSVAVAGVASEPRTFYFGGADGGIWKTVNGGNSWSNVSDCCLKVGAIGALAVAPSDPNVIYAGTGEPFPRGDMATGDGVWKSTDAGKTWTHVGLDDTRVIGAIVVDPRNANHVYVAALGHVFGANADRGVYESFDGGATWKKIFYVDQNTGAVDLVMDPANSRVLYAAMWQVTRSPWFFGSGGPGSGLYKTTDDGATWKNLSQNPGMPTGTLGRIGVAVSASDPNRVYAIVEAKSGGVFRSDDGGATWQLTYSNSDLRQRAWYFSQIYVDPKNPDRVYAPQVEGLYVSSDGGNTFQPLDTPHGDNHVLWIDPQNPDAMIVGNDGGAGVSYDAGLSWSSEDNQPTAQFYHVALDDQFPFHIYGAQQDNSTVEITSRNTGGYAIGIQDWRPVAGGESGFVVPVPGSPWITYGGGYDGALERLNTRTGEDVFLDPWPDNGMGHPATDLKYRFQWTYPIVVSKHEPDTLYVGSQYVMKSSDGGMTWQTISPDLTRNDAKKQASSGGPITQDNTSVEYYDTVFALAESPLKAGVLWAGTDDGRVWVTRDDGQHWSNVTPQNLPQWATVSIIDPSPLDPATAFLAARRYRQDDYAPYIYKTTDYGAHWQKIVNGLPNDESSFVVRQDTKDANLLFAGTLRGVYVSFDGGMDWQSLQLKLPHVAIRDIAIQPQYDALVLATHGRAFWVLDNLEPLREMSQAAVNADAFLFTPQTTYLTGGGSYPGANADGSGENPPNGVAVFYELKQSPQLGDKVTLTFADASGKTVAAFSNVKTPQGKPVEVPKDFYPPKHPQQEGVVPTESGMNEFVWNLELPSSTALPGSASWIGSIDGPRVPPGTYTATLNVGGKNYSRQFTVAKDPRSSVTQAQLEAQFTLLSQIHAKADAVAKAVLNIRKLRDGIQAYQPRLAAGSAGAKQATAILAKLDTIEQALLQTKSHAVEDPLNYPIRLWSKLLILGTEFDDESAPTQSERQVWQQLSAQADAQLQALDKVQSQDIPQLNATIKQANLPPITTAPAPATGG